MNQKRLLIVAVTSMTLVALELAWTRIMSAEFSYTYASVTLSLAAMGLGLLCAGGGADVLQALDHPGLHVLRSVAGMELPHDDSLRTTGDLLSLAASVRRDVEQLDASMPVADPRTMTHQLGVSLFPARLGGVTLGIFGIPGMILAAMGLYSVMAYSVSQRTREIGIRVALGAHRGSVIGMVIGKSLTLVGIGLVLGLSAATGASRPMGRLIYGMSAIDPVTFLGVPSVLCAVALFATFLPAQRAASIDPAQALRAQ